MKMRQGIYSFGSPYKMKPGHNQALKVQNQQPRVKPGEKQ